jgi:hypothetical protein
MKIQQSRDAMIYSTTLFIIFTDYLESHFCYIMEIFYLTSFILNFDSILFPKLWFDLLL